jgi:hypothetical protein
MKIKCNCGENVKIEEFNKNEPLKVVCSNCENEIVINDTRAFYKKYIALLVLDVFFMLSIILGAILVLVTLNFKFDWRFILIIIGLIVTLFSLWEEKKIALRIIGTIVIVSSVVLLIWDPIWFSMPKHSSKRDFLTSINAQNEVTITGYKGKSEEVVVPKKIKGMPVIAIGDGAFKGSAMIRTVQQYNFKNQMVSPALYNELRNNMISSIVLPDSIETIGNNAFEYTTSLTNIVIPNSVKKIGYNAFSNSGLIEIIIPDSVESIGMGAFENNNLRSIVIPASIKVIKENTFNENKLTKVVIPDSVETIEKKAFGNNKLTSIIIPNSVISIRDDAFENNNLTSIFIPESVKSIGNGAFKNNQINSITISDNVNLGARVFDIETERQRTESRALRIIIDSKITDTVNYHYNRNGKKKMIFRFLKIDDFDIAIIDETFVEIYEYYGSQVNIVIPEKIDNIPVLTIGENAFRNKQITNIIIPDTVKEIRASAFRTNKITNITIPLSVQTIGYAAFADNPLIKVEKSNNIVVDKTSFYSKSEMVKLEEEEKNKYDEQINKITEDILRQLTGIMGGEISDENN